MTKGKKILTIVLVFALLLNHFSAFANTTENEANNVYEKTKARLDFEFETGTTYQSDDEIDVMVALQESYFDEYGRNYSGKELMDGLNYQNQIDFSHLANEKALAQIKAKGIDLEVIYSYELLWLGFSARLLYADALALADLPFIKSVQPAVTYQQPETTIFNEDARMLHSRKIVGQDKVYSRYKGEGTVIAVIDSGFDTTHPAFYISDEFKDSVKIKREDVESLLNNKQIAPGQYINEKIPFAYNYEKRNNAIKEQKVESHGQHVAGTAAGNVVNMEEGVFSGIAPEAQFLAMRVFPDGGGTQDTIYVKAMEDAVKLGADSMNLSLGSSAGSLRGISQALEDVVNKAADMGIVIAIAAGNDSHFGQSVSNPKATEPDYGIMATPAISPKSLAVASYANTKIMQNYITLTRNGVTEEIGFVQPGDSQLKFDEEPMEIVYSGLGMPEDFPEEVRGKYALIERGAITFKDKINNAADKGAVGAIIFNHAVGGNDFISMSAEGIRIPAASIQRDVALRIKENITEYTVKVNNKIKAFDSKTSGYISDFSNWGLTAEGDLKPEIMAPGGNIYSAAANDLYANMSGTSMASPHVAGGIVLVKSRVNQEFPELTDFQKYELIKNLLMSTATPHINLDTNTYSSPRNQGAGIMNLQGALNGDVILYDKQTQNTKINLGDVEEKFQIKVAIKNLKDAPTSYRYKTYVITDQVRGDYITLDPRELMVVEGEEIRLAGKEEKEVTIDVDTSAFTADLTKKMPNGYFLEGFVIFENTSEENAQPNLSIPFLGFKGNFGALETVEPFVYELAEEGRLPKYYKYEKDGSFAKRDFTHFFTAANNRIEILGQVDNFNPAKPQFGKLVISPNGDGNLDEMGIAFTLLRNISEIKLELFAASDTGFNNVMGELFSFKNDGGIPKNYYSGDERRLKAYSTVLKNSEFGKPEVVDGEYKVVLTAPSLVPNAAPNKKVLDLYIDRKAPRIENVQYDKATRWLTFDITDEVSGIKSEAVILEENGKKYYLKKEEQGYRVPEGVSLLDVSVEAEDYGYNKVQMNLGVELLEEYGSLETTVEVNPVTADIPSFTERIVSADDESKEWKKDKLPYGEYKLYVENIASGYQLLGENPITFTVSEQNKNVSQTLRFATIGISRVSIEVPQHLKDSVKVRAMNVATKQNYALMQFTYGTIKLPIYYTNLPYGTYQFFFDIPTEGKTLSLEGLTDNTLEVNQSRHNLTAKEVDDKQREVTIHTVPQDLQVEYTLFNLATRKEVTAPLGDGVYLVFPKNIPAGYLVDNQFQRVVVDQNTTEVELTFTYQKTEEKEANIEIVSNHEDYDITPEYLLVDIATYLELSDNKIALKDNPQVPYGNYIFMADKSTYDASKLEMEELLVAINKENVTLNAQWQEVNETHSLLSLDGDLPEEINEVTLTFIGKYKKPFVIKYNKADYTTHSITLRHDTYQVVASDLPEGYVLSPNGLTVRHSGESQVSFAVQKESEQEEDLLPNEYGFGRIILEVHDEAGNPVTDVTANLYHNDALVDWKEALPYAIYEARIEDLNTDKYFAVEERKEVTLNKNNRLERIVLKVGYQPVLLPYIPEPSTPSVPDSPKPSPDAEIKEETVPLGDISFKDVKEDAWYAEAVNFVKTKGLMQGMTKDEFKPNHPVSRGMVVTILYRLEKEPQIDKEVEKFTDVDDKAYYAKAVKWANSEKIILGFGDGTFRPEDVITREQLAHILAKYAEFKKTKEPVLALELSFVDRAEVSDYAKESVMWATQQSLLNGRANGKLAPKDSTTRAELAKVLQNFVGKTLPDVE